MAKISESDIGKRVTIRLHDAPGYRDIVGVLKSIDSLENRHSEIITFDPNEIFLWREIVDSPRTATSGAPLSVRIYELEKISSETWPAREEESIGGWLFKADQGITKRANSALVLNAENNIDQLITWYRNRNLIPAVSLVPQLQPDLDQQFAARGFNKVLDVAVMVKDGEAITPINEIDLDKDFYFDVADLPSTAWLAVHKDEAIQELLTKAPAKYLSLKNDSGIIAIGRVAINSGWAVFSRIWVAPELRSQGYGRKILQALESCAGKNKIALQVSTENEIAIKLYESAGFVIHHVNRFRELSPQINLSQDCSC